MAATAAEVTRGGSAGVRGVGPDGSIAALKAVAWTPAKELDYARWVKEGRRLGLIGRASPWWIGDWILYAEGRWGEKYAEAERITGYDRKTLRNIRYVASRFDMSLRRDTLTWSHHAQVAALELEDRVRWLDRAIADRLTVDDLRQELRCERRGVELSKAREIAATAPAADESLICPHCGNDVYG